MNRSELTASAAPPPQALAAAPRTSTALVGRTLGRVEIVAKLGAGGMADVWLGRIRAHGEFARLVAVKTVHEHLCRDERSRAMFLREAEIAASIRHANVVGVDDVGEVDGVLYQVMMLVEGDNFAVLQSLQRDPLPVGVVTSIVEDALLGLHAAHEAVDERGRPRAIVHRDVSPHNILVGLDGVARVTDFGIAKAFSVTDDTTGSLRGKCAYFSPEQAREAPLDRRSDVFSMGIVLWEALTGTRLFRRETLVETLGRVLDAPIPDARELVPTIPGPVAEVAARALVRDVARRYPTAEAMAHDLTRAARESGCLLARRDVASAVDALVGPIVRARRAEAAASAPASPPVSQKVAKAAPGRGKRRVGLALAFGAGIAVASVIAFQAARRGSPATTSASTTATATATATETAAPIGVTTAVASEPEAPPSSSAEITAKPPSSAEHPRSTRRSAPRRAPPAGRKPPFDENPYGSPRSP